MKKVLMVVVVMLLVASGVYFGYSQGVNKNDNNHNTSEESKKNETNENNDISIDDLNEINDIAGLGMYSMERILSSSPSIINERSIESKSDMLFQIFIRSNILEYKGSDDPVYKSEEYLNNKELSNFCKPGDCYWLSFDNYKKITKKYGITNDGSDFFKYTYNNEYYVFYNDRAGIDPFDPNYEQRTYKKEKNDIIVTSKWHGYNHENTTNEERIFTFTFKRNSDKEYYLYSADSQTTE